MPILTQRKNPAARLCGSAALAAFSLLITFCGYAKEATDLFEAGTLSSLLLHVQTAPAVQGSPGLRLKGADGRQQILATAQFSSGAIRDYTRKVTYSVSPEGVVGISKSGMVFPLGDGATIITARSSEGMSATLPVSVEQAAIAPPINFANQIVPIFTKNGCNGGGCHGKSSGQNGFRLSLLGFEPSEDYEHLVKETRGRRLFPAAPDRSLLLVKGTATLPHGGGKRLQPESEDYKLLVRWISQGMPYGRTNDPTVARIEVFPKERTLPFNGEQQLVVRAHYSDGSMEDVTRSALFEANDKEMAKISDSGLVSVAQQPGDVAVMVRYQAKVAVFQATIPLGAPVDSLPAPKNFIDELVFAKLKRVGMPPSEICDDSTFLRRAAIDIAGRLPTPAETKKFLADQDPAKREKWINSLVQSAGYADYFASKWSALLRNKRSEATQIRGTYAFNAWIRDSLMANKPFDQFVREILAASGDMGQNPPVAWYRQVRTPNSQLEDTAQLFLGMRLQCAQCHHHPYEKWSQQDYYSFAAFFSQVGRKAGSQPGEEVIFHKRGTATATNKKTQKTVKPAGLGAVPVGLSPDDDPRQALADWMVTPDNPFFARCLVNRYWKHFFGRGLVDPEDDMRETNPATNPTLLEALARNFVESGFDLQKLVRTICSSRVYQLSAIPNKFNEVDKQNFSRFYPKRLTAEVLLDAVNLVTQSETRFEGLPAGTRAVQLPDNSFNASSYFLTVFGRPDSSTSCECERSQDASLAQSLHLLNSKDVQDKLTSDQGRPALLAADSRQTDEAKVQDLYYWAYARAPDRQELELGNGHLEKKSRGAKDPVAAKRQAYEYVIWALINTKEFLFNH